MDLVLESVETLGSTKAAIAMLPRTACANWRARSSGSWTANYSEPSRREIGDRVSIAYQFSYRPRALDTNEESLVSLWRQHPHMVVSNGP